MMCEGVLLSCVVVLCVVCCGARMLRVCVLCVVCASTCLIVCLCVRVCVCVCMCLSVFSLADVASTEYGVWRHQTLVKQLYVHARTHTHSPHTHHIHTAHTRTCPHTLSHTHTHTCTDSDDMRRYRALVVKAEVCCV